MTSSLTISSPVLLASFTSLSCMWYFMFSCQDFIDLQKLSSPDELICGPQKDLHIFSLASSLTDRFGDTGYQNKSLGAQK